MNYEIPECFEAGIDKALKAESDHLETLRMIAEADERAAEKCGCNNCRHLAERSREKFYAESKRIGYKPPEEHLSERLVSVALLNERNRTP